MSISLCAQYIELHPVAYLDSLRGSTEKFQITAALFTSICTTVTQIL
jgi:hypothetical protein